ncbi:Translocation protein sec63-like protein [Thalictrum thalictroides]|uniref:Translocation protein sec63-like protein n=1 Tax=Thalictrum thalictroides TaxID=46969 RepID=A0A7J6XG45_THATH|nr:Translocation protein sec63-like protein [Thalictrum thalictroides]
MGVLVYYIKHISREEQPFEPYCILGLERGASDSEIKKTYRRLSIQYHPDKNPDPEANKYFVEFIAKAYQALIDPISRENFEKYGHPDGRQGFQMGIALPQFLLNIDGASGGILLLGIVGVCILFPLVAAVIFLSRSSKYTGNNVMHQTLSTYYYFMKPSLAPRSELNLDLKNSKQEQAKFWKQHPALVKTELLVQTQLTRETADLSSVLQDDFRHVLELAPRLLEELMKARIIVQEPAMVHYMAVIPRTPQSHGWLRPAIGVVELSQSIIQAVPLSARKASGGSTESTAPFLQLPHFSEAVIKKIARKKVRTFQELQDMTLEERA